MFGWEFPPFFAGGVGTVCYELTKQLSADGLEIQFVMPFCPDSLNPGFLKIHNAKKSARNVILKKHEFVKIKRINSILAAYQTEEEYKQELEHVTKLQSKIINSEKNNTSKLYGSTMFEEIQLFAKRAGKMYSEGMFDDFDVIHAHDWTTLPAALEVKRLSGKPMCVHVHITEFNKTGNNTAHPEVFKTEMEGFHGADKVIAISHLIEQTVKEKYHVPEEKIKVIHNGGIKMDPVVETDKKSLLGENYKEGDNIVLFAGRVTGMKGPLRFVEMAKKVLEHKPNTLFVMAGTGDQLDQCINRAHQLGIYDRFNFFGFFNRDEAEKLYNVADVFVLPSQLEPFGVTPLEAMLKETPVVLSRQSGVAEVVNNCLITDFWDIDKMASSVIGLLTYPALHKLIKREGTKEAEKLDWKKPAKQCEELYARMVA